MAVVPKDVLKSKFETGDRPTGSDYADLIDTTSFHAESLGADGNNEKTITGLENETLIESVPLVDWRSLKYNVSLSAISGGQNKFYSTEFNVLIDKTAVNITEFGGMDNDGEIGTIVVSADNGLLKLTVTPDPDFSPVTVRFYRTGLKA